MARGLAIATTGACIALGLGCNFAAPSASPPREDAAIDAAVDAAPDAALDQPCLGDPEYTNYDGHRYRVIGPGGMPYDRAVERCAKDGAHLAVIGSAAENEFLFSLRDGHQPWLGYDDLTVEGSFGWITGEAPAYTRFRNGEPNDNPVEDCVYLRDDRDWNDTDCNESRQPACECDPLYEPPPMPACLAINDNVLAPHGRRYIRRDDPKTWQEAAADCAAIGAHLPVIADADENVDLDGGLMGARWIGYSDLDVETAFAWIDQSPATYTNWGGGGGVPANDTEDCAVLQDGGTWDDQACDQPQPYACECDPAPP